MLVKHITSFLKLHSSGLIIIVVGFVTTFFSSYKVDQQEMSLANYEFTKRASDASRSVHTLFENSIQAITFLAAYIDNSKTLQHQNFISYSTAILASYHDMQALEWAPKVEGVNLTKFEKDNSSVMIDFIVTQRNEKGEVVPVSKREVYFPVQYAAPIIGNENALGYDISSNPIRKEMLQRSMEQNELTASARVRLVQEKGDSFAILVAKPVYANDNSETSLIDKNSNLRGYAIGVYRINNIIEDSLLLGSYLPTSFRFTDDTSSSEESLLYEIISDQSPSSDWFNYTESIDIAGRTYTLHFNEDPRVFLPVYPLSAITILVGLLLTLIIASYVDIIGKRNLELRHSNDNLTNALKEIQTLQGIIPICSYCHAIRDDEGAWNRVEEYISNHSEAKFSHGVCPSCAEHEIEKFRDKNG